MWLPGTVKQAQMGEGENMVEATGSPVSRPAFEIVVVSPEEQERGAVFPNEVSTLITSVTNRDAEQVLDWADEQESIPLAVICFVASIRAGYAQRLLAWSRDIQKIRAQVDAALDTADCPQSAPPASPSASSEVSDG